MNAIEYVKKNGIEKSKIHLDRMKQERWINSFFNDLKQIVEAFDLVGNFGGLALSKYHLLKVKNSYSSECYYTDEHGNHFKTYEHVLEKAINLVEQCNAKS